MRLHRLVFRWLCFRIFVAKQTIGRLILLDFGEATRVPFKAVVTFVVVGHADLAQKHVSRAGLDLKIVVESLGDENALAGSQADLGACGNHSLVSVGDDGDVGDLVNAFVGEGIVNANENVSAASVDNVLGLVPMKMIEGIE